MSHIDRRPLAGAPSEPAISALAVELCVEQLMRDGFVIVPEAMPADAIAALDREVAARFERTPFCQGQFSGETTKRFGGLLKRCEGALPLVDHPLVLAVVNAVLGAHCDSIQLNLTQAIEIHPGAGPQIPHRDQDMYGTSRPPCEMCINVMWPLTEFTEENGATILWPASNDLGPMEIPELDTATIAAMKPGSAVIFLGSTLHCAGANRSDAKRRGLAIGYSLGWLRQFENQYLVYPPEVAARLPRHIAELAGYRTQKPNLGNFEGRCPSIVLDGPVDDHLGLVDNLPAPMADLIALHAADPDRFLAQASAPVARAPEPAE